MKVFLKVLGLYLLFSVLILGRSTGASTEPMEPKAVFEKRCSRCHSLDKANRTETPERWKAIVKKMKAKWFSGISDEDAEVITRYLIEKRAKK
jgi:hypothetical protein